MWIIAKESLFLQIPAGGWMKTMTGPDKASPNLSYPLLLFPINPFSSRESKLQTAWPHPAPWALSCLCFFKYLVEFKVKNKDMNFSFPTVLHIDNHIHSGRLHLSQFFLTKTSLSRDFERTHQLIQREKDSVLHCRDMLVWLVVWPYGITLDSKIFQSFQGYLWLQGYICN